jgi:GAF domain-containing protein
MDEHAALDEALSALSRYFVGDCSLEQTLTRVAELARDAIGDDDEVGITMIVDGKPGTWVCTDPSIPEVDQAQYETGDGPCLQAYDTGKPVLLRSTLSSADHPHFCEVAIDHGIFSVASFPLATPVGRIGAMNHYAGSKDAFGPAEMALGQRFAHQASFLLANATAYWDARTLSEDLRQAMASRATIEQAKGIIMATTGVDADEAFVILREQSQNENVKVRELACELVRRQCRR